MKIPLRYQISEYDCGPTSLFMLVFSKSYSLTATVAMYSIFSLTSISGFSTARLPFVTLIK